MTLTELNSEVDEILDSLVVTDAEVIYFAKSTVNQEHTKFQLSKMGLCLCKEFPYIGASPDG